VARVKISLANDQVVDLHKEVRVDGIPFVLTLVEEKPSLPVVSRQSERWSNGGSGEASSSVGSEDRVPAVATWEVFSDGDCSEKGFDTRRCVMGQGQNAKVDLGGSNERVAKVSESKSAKVGANRLENLQGDIDNSLLVSGLGDIAGDSRDQV
jgi:hypothetical protein